MAGSLIRDVRRATLARAKADVALTDLVPAGSHHPSTVPANPQWPFTRFDAPSSIPVDGPCHAGATVTFMWHAFAKPLQEDGVIIETAEDQASRIADAMKLCVHERRIPVTGGTARLRVRSIRLMQDGAEADAYHAVLSIEARALAA